MTLAGVQPAEIGPDDALLPAWCEVMAAVGYEVRTWRDRTPDELLDDRAVLEQRMTTDAPHGNLPVEEEERWDGERIREYEASHLARGRTVLSAGALKDGRLVAFTTRTPPRPWSRSTRRSASAPPGSCRRGHCASIATLHCLTGWAIGAVLGMVIGTALGWSDGATIAPAVALGAFLGGCPPSRRCCARVCRCEPRCGWPRRGHALDHRHGDRGLRQHAARTGRD